MRLAIPLGLLLFGCGPKDEEIVAPDASNVPFAGKPDAKLAGTYKTKDNTVYVLKEDGGFRFDGKTSTPKGIVPTHGEGQWALDGNRLLFKDKNGVVPYTFVEKGKDLTLSLTGSMKNETIFVRQ